ATEPGHLALVGAPHTVECEPAAASGQELDAFAAGAGDADDAVADQGEATVDDRPARYLDQAVGPTGEQRATIGDRAAPDNHAYAMRLDDRTFADRAAVERQRGNAEGRNDQRAGRDRDAAQHVVAALGDDLTAGEALQLAAGDRAALDKQRGGAAGK